TFVRGMWELDSYNFPIFSSTDIFTKPLLSKLGKLTQDDFNSYWKSLLESGHVTDIFMTPNWQISNGATAEYNIAKEKNLVIHYWDINPKDCVILFVAPEDAKRHIYYTSDKPPHYMIHPSAMARDMRFLKTVGEMEFKEVKAMVDRHIRHSRRLAGEKSRNLEDSNRKWEEYYRGQDEYEVVIAQLRKDQASQNTK
ncbi:MAG: DUF4406 domain-containing protein, partial [Candidatus Micrarchaeaceae archaeon]